MTTRSQSRHRVDPEHIIVEGFSDGASYGLGLGIANGDVFTRVPAAVAAQALAWSLG